MKQCEAKFINCNNGKTGNVVGIDICRACHKVLKDTLIKISKGKRVGPNQVTNFALKKKLITN